MIERLLFILFGVVLGAILANLYGYLFNRHRDRIYSFYENNIMGTRLGRLPGANWLSNWLFNRLYTDECIFCRAQKESLNAVWNVRKLND